MTVAESSLEILVKVLRLKAAQLDILDKVKASRIRIFMVTNSMAIMISKRTVKRF